MIRVYDGSYPNGTILESYLYHPTENRILIKYGDYGSTTPDQAVVYVNDNLEKTYDVLSSTPRVNYTYYPSDENGLVGEIVKNSTNATLRTLYYHNDYSGSVSLITNGSGGVVEQTFYDPYGAILVGGDVSRYSYEGKEFSSVTEDFDFHFRKYDPSLMIFTQPDSVISNVYDPQSLNRYSFEKNNPYKYKDEDGKDSISITEGPGVSWAPGDFQPLVPVTVAKVIYNDHLKSVSELEVKLEQRYGLPQGKSAIGSSNGQSNAELLKTWKGWDLNDNFKIIVENDKIVKYTYNKEKTDLASMYRYEGFEKNLINNAIKSQFKTITGKNYYPSLQKKINSIKSVSALAKNARSYIWKSIGRRLFGSK